MKKKKWIISALSGLVVSCLLVLPASAKNDEAKQSLVSLGDSITFGYNLEVNNDHPSKEAFPYLIGQKDNLRVRDLGVPGWTSSQLVSAINSDEMYREAIRHADVITLDIGNNDLLHALQVSNGDPTQIQFAAQEMLANLMTSIKDIRKLTDAPIVIYNIYNPFQTTDPLHILAYKLLPMINPAIDQVVQSLTIQGVSGLYLADAYSAFGENQAAYVRLNDIHPTASGQQVLAQIGEETLAKVK